MQKIPLEPSHPYLTLKKIPMLGAKVEGDALVIPLTNIKGEIVGSQRILPDGMKKNATGTKLKGSFHRIPPTPEREKAIDAKTYIVEGFATGASVHQVTGDEVIVAFGAQNIPEIAKLFPHATVAADNDKMGIKFAKESKLSYTLPPIEGQDWNDYAQDNKPDEILFQLHNNLTQPNPTQNDNASLADVLKTQISFLGYDDGNFYYFRSKHKNIVTSVHVNSISKNFLYQLAPASFWNEHFMVYERKKAFLDLDLISSIMIEENNKAGFYQNKILYGQGFFWDGKDFFCNDGKEIVFLNSEKPNADLFKHKDHLGREFIASGGSFAFQKEKAKPLEKVFLDNLQKIDWKDCRHFDLFLGWLFCANLCGAIPWRPMIWITGGSDIGKSDVSKIAKWCLPNHFAPSGKSSDASLKAGLKNSSIPIVFDEFETTNKKNRQRVESIIETCRNATIDNTAVVYNATQTMGLKQFLIRFCACVSSINTVLEAEQDVNRFCVLELVRNPKSLYVKENLSEWFEFYCDLPFRLNFLNLCVEKFEKFNDLRKKVFDILQKQNGSRFANVYSPLVAGSLVLQGINDYEKYLEDNIYFRNENIIQKNEEQLITTILTSSFNDQGKQITVSHAIQLCKTLPDPEYWLQRLEDCGINLNDDYIQIHRTHQMIKKWLYDTQWSVNWGNALEKIPGAKKSTARFSGIASSSVKIPLSIFYNQGEEK